MKSNFKFLLLISYLTTIIYLLVQILNVYTKIALYLFIMLSCNFFHLLYFLKKWLLVHSINEFIIRNILDLHLI